METPMPKAKSKRTTRSASRRKLSDRDVRRQQGAELPEREAMSLLLPSTGGLPMLPTDPTAPAAPYTTTAPNTADILTQAPNPNDVAAGGGENVPGGTATSSSST
jgi:hypothetical protein